jgi:hypothetical protein
MALNLALVLGAAALALWVYVRVADRAPSAWRMIIVHLALSVVFSYTLVPTIVAALGDTGSVPAGVVAVVGVALPAVAYMFLASLWLLAVLGRLLGQHAR